MTLPFVHEMFAAVAERQPTHPAITYGRRTLAYGELDRRADSLAHAVLARGLTRGGVVAVLTDDAIDQIACMLGILQAGGAYLAVDSAHPAGRIDAQLLEARPRLLLTTERGVKRLTGDGIELGEIDTILLDDRSVFTHDAARPESIGLDGDDLCYLFFTSGSTGRPKAIAGRHRGLSHFVQWEIGEFSVGPDTRGSYLSRPTFDVSLRDILVPLCGGGTVCIPNDRSLVSDPDRLLGWLNAEAITMSHMVPTVLRALLHAEVPDNPLPELRHLILAGEMLFPSDIARWRAAFGDRIALHNLYGPTETTLAKFHYRIQPHDGDRRGAIPVGRPLPDTRLLIVGERGRATPDGTIGEVYIGTRYRALGYYGQPILTAERFVNNPVGAPDDEIWYRTGDLGRVLESGELQLVGRQDGQVKISGVRVELGEIEELLRHSPELADCAVLDWPAPDGGRVLCAYYVSEQSVDEAALRDRLARSLPSEAVPAAFRRLAELPRTLTDKVDRRMLPPPDLPSDSGPSFVSPRNATEATVAEIAAKVLNRDKVNVEADLFSIGANSLQAMILLARVSKRFGVTVPLAGLLESRTVAGLSRVVDQVVREGMAAETAIPRLAR